MVPRKNPRGGQRREQSGRRSRTRLDWGARSNTWSIGLSCVGLRGTVRSRPAHPSACGPTPSPSQARPSPSADDSGRAKSWPESPSGQGRSWSARSTPRSLRGRTTRRRCAIYIYMSRFHLSIAAARITNCIRITSRHTIRTRVPMSVSPVETTKTTRAASNVDATQHSGKRMDNGPPDITDGRPSGTGPSDMAEGPSDLAASMRSASARPTASCSFNAPRGSSTRLRRRLSSRSRVGGRGAPADMVGPGSRARSHCEPAVPPRTAMHIARSSRRTVGVLTVDQAVLASEGRNNEKRRLCRHLS